MEFIEKSDISRMNTDGFYVHREITAMEVKNGCSGIWY